jgi:acyl-CoA synthetase (AMP-forming)/AMP-acid ligase II
MLRTDLIRPLQELIAVHVAERGQRTSFMDESRSLTWAELEARTARLAGHLRSRAERGHPVAICMGNRLEAVESYLAVARAGNIGVFLNPAAADNELAYMLEDSGAEVLISDTRQRKRTWSIVERAPAIRETIVVERAADDEASARYESLLEDDPPDGPADDLGLDEPAWMLYTSGTTGKPKGVLLTQRSCLWVVAACWTSIVGLSSDDLMLSALPLFHSYALDLTVIAIVASGATIRLLPRYSPKDVIDTLRSEEVTVFPGVPTMFQYLVEHLGDQELKPKALRLCISAGAIMPQALTAAFERVARVPLLDGYGITETSTMVTMNWPTGERPPGSCGLPLPGCAVRLVDPRTGTDVKPGEDGELIVRGPQVMLGYHNRPNDTADVLRDGWYHSGDLARSDSHGYLTVTGRIKELIIRGGENVYPAEVEQTIAEHPGVSDAAVIGKPDHALGEIVVAFVVRDDERLSADDLRSFAGERLAEFKIPANFEFIDQIPRTGSGKIMRHRLRERIE